MEESSSIIKNVLGQFQSFTKNPEEFVEFHESLANELKHSTKALYDFTKLSDDDNDALPELIIESFDDEQIWQQLELQNEPVISDLFSEVAHIATSKKLNFNAYNTKSKIQLETGQSNDIDSGEETADIAEETEDIDDENESDEEQTDEEPLFGNIKGGSDESEEEKELISLLDKHVKALAESAAGNSEESDVDSDSDSTKMQTNKGYQTNREVEEITNNDDADKSKKSNVFSEKARKRRSIVDDKFFKLSDMEAFLEMEDAKEEKKQRQSQGQKGDEGSEDDDSEEELNFFEDIPSTDEDSDGKKAAMYSSFFDVPDDEEQVKKKKAVKFQIDKDEGTSKEKGSSDEQEYDGKDDTRKLHRYNLFEESDNEGEDVEDIFGGKKENKSTFEKRQERIKAKISDLEKKNLAEKPWQLKGEVSAGARPENSLMEVDLDFDHTTRQAPVITEETTLVLEDLIKQRIKDQAWDDVERKVKPVGDAPEYKKKLVLDQEKSKKSLSQIYEEEYLKQQEKTEKDETDPEHETIKKMMTSLFIKLDALSNFHYTPKPSAPEVTIISNLPSISMEEVAPVAVSDAALMAPQEIQEKPKGDVKGETERSDTDKKHDRRIKKKGQKARKLAQEKKQKLVAKLNPGLGNKYAKEKAMKELEKLGKLERSGITVVKEDKSQGKGGRTSSARFFSQLQDEVKTKVTSRKVKKKNSIQSVSKYKL